MASLKVSRKLKHQPNALGHHAAGKVSMPADIIFLFVLTAMLVAVLVFKVISDTYFVHKNPAVLSIDMLDQVAQPDATREMAAITIRLNALEERVTTLELADTPSQSAYEKD